jgi:hypothetical protein
MSVGGVAVSSARVCGSTCVVCRVHRWRSPKGDLFCRECIYTNLLTQREKLEEQRRLYDAQEADRAVRAEVTPRLRVSPRLPALRLRPVACPLCVRRQAESARAAEAAAVAAAATFVATEDGVGVDAADSDLFKVPCPCRRACLCDR